MMPPIRSRPTNAYVFCPTVPRTSPSGSGPLLRLRFSFFNESLLTLKNSGYRFAVICSKSSPNINEALLTLDLCFNNQTAIGEHTSEHFLEEASKALTKLTDARDRLDTLEYYYNQDKIKKQLND